MHTSTQLADKTIVSISATLQIIASALVAIVVLYGVGFNEMDIAHNSAHDARHAAVFPCH